MTAQPSALIRAILLGIAALALAVPVLVVRYAPDLPPARIKPIRRAKVIPATVLPPVEPVAFVDLEPEDARAFNADVPFSTGANPAARAFRLRAGPENLARATDCLATAVLYEAGGDRTGQRAVAQVVINRARHPAFPKTICGVVFEGQERSTGCQFSFTCDGALTRWAPSASLWATARKVAGDALTGTVFRPVGHATHYHTDWVVPYWQSSLDKITKVGTHLFFRWTGWWGTPPAFNRQIAAAEPAIAKIAAFSDAHRSGAALAEAEAALGESAALVAGAPQSLADDADSFLLTLPAGLTPEAWPPLAAQACGERVTCRFSAWSEAARTPVGLPLGPDQVATMTFSYLRDRTTGVERTLWNCRQVRRTNPRECMRQQVLLTGVPPAIALPVPRLATAPERAPAPERASAVRASPPPLTGVRRSTEPGAAPVIIPRLLPTPRPSPTPRGTSPGATP